MAIENDANEALRLLVESSNTLTDAQKQALLAQLRLNEALDDTASFLEQQERKNKKIYDNASKRIEELTKAFDQNALTAETLEEELNTLRNSIERTSNQEEKRELIRQKALLEEINARNKANDIFKSASLQAGGALIKGVFNTAMAVRKSFLSGGDVFAQAQELLTGRLDTQNEIIQTTTNAFSNLGQEAAKAGGKLGKWGVGLTVAAEAAAGISAKYTEQEKARISFILSSGKQFVSTFQQLSSAGAYFGAQLQDSTNVAKTAYMNLDQFAKVVTDNRDKFSKMGMDVTTGSKRLAKAMEAGGQAARNGMFALGMGVEEQAAAFANTMVTMAGPLGRLNATNTEIAEATTRYAANLKVISAITGEDAKLKQEKIRQEQDNLWMDGHLAEMSKEQRESWNAIMQTASDTDRRALIEMEKYGAVRSVDLAGQQAMVPALEKQRRQLLAIAKSGDTDAVEQSILAQAQNAKTIQGQGTALSKTVGLVETGPGLEMGKAIHDAIKYAAALQDPKKMAELIESIKSGQKTGAEGGSELARTMAAQQENLIKQQNLAVTGFKEVISALDSVTNRLEGLMSGPSLIESTKDTMIGLLPTIGSLVMTYLMTKKMIPGSNLPTSGSGGSSPISATGRRGSTTGASASSTASRWKPVMPKLSTIGKGVGGIIGGLALDYAAGQAAESGHTKTAAGLDIASNALGMASTGAMIGSVIPGIGTAVGGAVGGLAGAGYGLYQNWGNLWSDDTAAGTPKPSAAPGSKPTPSASGSNETTKKTPMEAVQSTTTEVEKSNRLLQEQNNMLKDMLKSMQENTRVNAQILQATS